MRKSDHRLLLTRTTVILLLFALAGLSALAKQSKYLPESNPIHFLSNATKMNVAHAPVLFVAAPLSALAKVVPPQPTYQATQRTIPE
jgi:hypothetical protein